MKKLFKFLSVVLLMVVFTGCTKQTVHNTITNGEITIEVTDAMDSSLITEDEVTAKIEEYKGYGFDVRAYEPQGEDNFLGIVYSKTYKLEEVASDTDVEFHLETIDSSLMGTEPPKMFKKVGENYQAKFIFDTSAADTGDYTAEELESYADQFVIGYSVTLPSQAITHNADTVEGTTYTWNVKYGEKKEINFEFNPNGSSVPEVIPPVEEPTDEEPIVDTEPPVEDDTENNVETTVEDNDKKEDDSMILYIIIGAVVIVAIIIIVLIAKGKKGKSVQPAVANGMYNQVPVQPTPAPVQTPSEQPVQPAAVQPVPVPQVEQPAPVQPVQEQSVVVPPVEQTQGNVQNSVPVENTPENNQNPQ